jgi:glycosyltransferase involved in cell wall biosynthesis
MRQRESGAAEPEVTVMTPCHNAASFIGATLRGVREQTFTRWEHIVVDDGSTDESGDRIRRAAQDDRRIRLITQSAMGVGAARNAGFRASSPASRYLLFLDADDVPKPAMLERLVAYLDDRPDVGVVYCDLDFIDAGGGRLPYRDWNIRYVPTRFGLRSLPSSVRETPFAALFNLAAGQPSRMLMRRSTYLRTGGWDEGFGQIYEDTDLLLRLALEAPVHYFDEPLLFQRLHATSATADAAQAFAAQEDRLYRLWRAREADPRSGAAIRAARRFREQRVLPWLGLQAGARRLSRGEIGDGCRFILGAVRIGAVARFSARHAATGRAKPDARPTLSRTASGAHREGRSGKGL